MTRVRIDLCEEGHLDGRTLNALNEADAEASVRPCSWRSLHIRLQAGVTSKPPGPELELAPREPQRIGSGRGSAWKSGRAGRRGHIVSVFHQGAAE